MTETTAPKCADCDVPLERDSGEDATFVLKTYLGWKCPVCGWQEIHEQDHGNA